MSQPGQLEVPLAQGSARRTVRATESTFGSLKVARTGTWTWPPGATVWRGWTPREPVKGLGVRPGRVRLPQAARRAARRGRRSLAFPISVRF